MSTLNYMTPEELGIQNHICVLPCGEEIDPGISKWSVKDLKPYQSYLFHEIAVDRLFRGIIFNSVTGRENHFLNPMYSDFGQLAQKRDWSLALKRLFLENYNFDAARVNTPINSQTDIWVTLPYPVQYQTEFGKIKEKALNFKVAEDRLIALKWWIDWFLRKWKKAEHLHKKLTFKGFVWPRASIDSSDEELVKNINDYIHSKALLSLWLQQYGSAGCIEWRTFGFDAACSHPNFYGKVGPDFKWIPNTTVFAKYYHTGMQIIYGKGALFKENHLLDYLNYGVYNDYMNDSLLVFQFPNQTMREIYETHPSDYAHLYSFIKKNYKPQYPTAAFS